MSTSLPAGYTLDKPSPTLPPGYTVDAPTAAPQPSMLSQAGTAAKNVGVGLLKGAGSTMSSADEFARQHLPAFMTNTGMGFGKPENIPAVHQMMQPQGTAQTIGKGIEQAGEFLAPGAAEGKLAELGTHAGRIGEIGSKLLGSAVGAGAVNKAQGGSFKTGAELGAGGAGLGEALHAAAPVMAESAMQLPKRMRGFGKTTGRAILDETTGVRPETVGASAKTRIGELNNELEGLAAQRPRASASLTPARQVLRDAGGLAQSQNARTLGGQLGDMRQTLTRQYDTGKLIPPNVPPSRLLNLKRGFSEEHLGWNPDLHERAQAAGRSAYGALDKELDRTVPGAEGLNQRISSLIPAKVRGESLGRDNPFLQRMGQRIGARTGALTLGGIGGAEGYREHGAPGAALGFLAGAAAPELIADPTAQMGVARLLNKANTLRPAVGLLSQATERKNQ